MKRRRINLTRMKHGKSYVSLHHLIKNWNKKAYKKRINPEFD